MSARIQTASGLPFSGLRNGVRRTPWAIVLAGGTGSRMGPAIQRWLKEDRPKQFCTFAGTRSMLQHTIDRALGFVAPAHVVTVIRGGQERWLADSLAGPAPGHVIAQPDPRGTAAAVYTALAAIREQDPDATVVVLPSDHFVTPDRVFAREMVHACLFADHFPERVVLVGATAESPESDYGWIGPGAAPPSTLARFLGRAPASVRHFVEKPPTEEARRLLRRGYLWNTGIVAGRASALWGLGRATLGAAFAPFDRLADVLGAVRRRGVSVAEAELVLEVAFAALPAVDFSRDVCQHPATAGAALLLPLRDVQWSDWGRPERVHATLAALGRPARLPVPTASDAFAS